MVMVSHNKNEMFFDFIQIMPHDPRARVQERVVMTPTHAKLFLTALQQNVDRYEAQFGEIDVPKRPQSLADQLFSGIQPAGDGDTDESEDDDGDNDDGDDAVAEAE